jgi:hypothetical protein
MIPAAPFFDPLFQNNAPKKEGANCAIITKRYQAETNVYSKAKFYRWHKIK